MPEAKRLIINIRGATSSGKTTLVRNFFSHATSRLENVELGKQHGCMITISSLTLPELQLPVTVIGPYDHRKYSGCDALKSVEAIKWAVSSMAKETTGHVLFEGFRVSKSYGPFAELRNQLVRETGMTWLWALLSAPKELIWERAAARREDGKEIDKKELEAVIRQMENTRTNVRTLWPGDVLTLDPARSPEEVFQRLLGEMAYRERGETLGVR